MSAAPRCVAGVDLAPGRATRQPDMVRNSIPKGHALDSDRIGLMRCHGLLFKGMPRARYGEVRLLQHDGLEDRRVAQGREGVIADIVVTGG